MCGRATHAEMTLRGAPDGGIAAFGHADDTGMGLDVALVNGGRGKFMLDDKVRLREPLLQIPARQRVFTGNVGGRVRRFVQSFGEQILVQNRCTRRNGLSESSEHRERLVLHDDGIQGLHRHTAGDRRNGRNRMSVIEHSIARHAVLGEIGKTTHTRAAIEGGKVIAGHHSQHPRNLARGRQVDALDARVGLGAS